MLQSFRNNIKGAGATIIVTIIIVPFAFFGVESLFVSGSSANQQAQVNGEPISEFEVLQALEISKQQLMEQYKDLDITQLNDAFLQEMVIEKLISDKVLVQQAKQTGMAVSVERVYPLLLEVPAYQVDGKFSSNRYEYIIQQMGYTPTTHAKAIGDEMLQQTFLQAVVESGISTAQSIDQLIEIFEQTRSYYYLTVPESSVAGKVSVSDEEITVYYEQNTDQFTAPEQVKVEYLLLELAKLSSEFQPDEQAIVAAFEDRIKDLIVIETRQVAHILIEKQAVDKDASLLSNIQSQLDAGGDFAVLAKRYSADLGSADQGGVLGSLTRGDLPASLDEALDQMQVGAVSAAIESDAGYHFLKLLDKQRSSDGPTLEMLRPELENNLKMELAKELYAQKLEEMQEVSYNASSLAETGQLLELPLQESEYFSRNGGAGITAIPEAVRASFSDDALIDGYPSNVIEISDEQALVLRVTDHKPEAVKSLDVVTAEVTDWLNREKTAMALEQAAEQFKGQILAGSSIEELAKLQDFEWQVVLDIKRSSTQVNREVQAFAFGLPVVRDTPVVDGFVNAAGDYVLVAISSTQAGADDALPKEQLKAFEFQYNMSSSLRDAKNYQQYLIDSADIEK